mmetsp:Transcript_45131/g.116757  ORF Transcript_45131/g.116757 Transcript_45131/m.116757 type:complete len:81 (-) Transcript_45131:1184-1426(-)
MATYSHFSNPLSIILRRTIEEEAELRSEGVRRGTELKRPKKSMEAWKQGQTVTKSLFFARGYPWFSCPSPLHPFLTGSNL